MKKLKKSNGFTLVELIVVIAMLAILTSVSVGGFEYSQKRAAIQNDKALVKQLNSVLDSYSIFTHDEAAMHDALIEEFGDTIEIQSLKFGYDIFCYVDLCEFYLLDQEVYEGNDKYICLSQYFNFVPEEKEPEVVFEFNNNYHYQMDDLFVTTNEQHIDIGIYINDSKSLKSFEINLSNIIFAHLKDSNDVLDTSYSCNLIRDLGYYPNDFETHFNLFGNSIIFNVPGIYEIICCANDSSFSIIANVRNIYLDNLDQTAFDISANHNEINYSINFYSSNDSNNFSNLSLEISKIFENITITDYEIGNFTQKQSITLYMYNDYIIYTELLVEIEGIQKTIQLSANQTTYQINFENIAFNSESQSIIIQYNYYASNGQWYSSTPHMIPLT